MMKSQNSCQKNTKKYIEWTVEILVTLVFMLFINIRYPGTVFADDGFEVQDGVLVGYSGTGGEVEIPEDVVKISGSAFQGNNTIIHVYMGDSVRELDTGAFASCSNLVTIQLSNNLTRIETLAFHNCENLKEIAFPESLSYIGACAFRGCNNLVSVWIPSGVNTIDYGAFSGCKRLKSIGSDAGNKNFTSISDVLYSEDKKIICQYPEGRTETSYHVLSGVDTIERDAFLDCSNLTSITLPVSVTRILPFAFYNCTNLEDISIPSSMHEIGESSFSYCTSLKLLSIPENVTTIGQDAFANCDLQLTGKVGSTAENYAKDNNIIFIEDNDQLIESISNEQISNESTINDGSESITASENGTGTISTEALSGDADSTSSIASIENENSFDKIMQILLLISTLILAALVLLRLLYKKKKKVKHTNEQEKREPIECPECHTICNENQNFCPKCGTQVRCMNCGKPCKSGDKFCRKCGKPIF